MRIIVGILAFAAATSLSPAQKSPAETLTVESVLAQLSSPKSTQRNGLIEQLGLSDVVSAKACYDVSEPKVLHLWGTNDNGLLAIEVASFDCVQNFLVVFEETANSQRFVGTIAMQDRINQPAFSVQSLLDDGQPAIVVSHLVVDEGTGVMQKNMQIFTVLKGELRLIFNQPEEVHLAIPVGQRLFQDDVVSKFTIVPSTTPRHAASITESRTTTLNERSLRELRRYIWSSRLQSYYSVAFAPSSK